MPQNKVAIWGGDGVQPNIAYAYLSVNDNNKSLFLFCFPKFRFSKPTKSEIMKNPRKYIAELHKHPVVSTGDTISEIHRGT